MRVPARIEKAASNRARACKMQRRVPFGIGQVRRGTPREQFNNDVVIRANDRSMKWCSAGNVLCIDGRAALK